MGKSKIETQEIVHVDEDPVEMFLRALDQLAAQGAIYFKSAMADSLTIEHSIIPENRIEGAKFVGYYSDDWLYLLLDVAYQIVVTFYRRSGRCFTEPAIGLKRKLKEKGALQVNPSERFRCKLRTGTNEYVWTLKIGRGYTDTIMASIYFETGTTAGREQWCQKWCQKRE